MLPTYLALPLTSKVSLKSAMLVRCPLEAHPLRLCRHHETLDVLERACGDQSVLALANKEDFFGLSLRNMLLSKKKKACAALTAPQSVVDILSSEFAVCCSPNGLTNPGIMSWSKDGDGRSRTSDFGEIRCLHEYIDYN